jgi:hypothetical protein
MYLKIGFVILALLALLFVYQQYTRVETFENYASLDSPSNNLLLSCSYPVNASNAGLSTYNHSYSAEKKVLIPMASYAQKTNNKRHWETPDNGTCPLTEMCGGLYSSKVTQPVSVLSPTNDGVRVNFYNQ